jgi:hypothetical protein
VLRFPEFCGPTKAPTLIELIELMRERKCLSVNGVKANLLDESERNTKIILSPPTDSYENKTYLDIQNHN